MRLPRGRPPDRSTVPRPPGPMRQLRSRMQAVRARPGGGRKNSVGNLRRGMRRRSGRKKDSDHYGKSSADSACGPRPSGWPEREGREAQPEGCPFRWSTERRAADRWREQGHAERPEAGRPLNDATLRRRSCWGADRGAGGTAIPCASLGGPLPAFRYADLVEPPMRANTIWSLLSCISMVMLGMVSRPRPRGRPPSGSGSICA